ncbi:MAG: hypothetical protein I8H75_03665 [Myxococcaceae bacterium]|nr:hypothetical protein [Myxococcaceae bacterium]MBH2006425.1 hypothetical protein [Myxococcaceae bacterium]
MKKVIAMALAGFLSTGVWARPDSPKEACETTWTQNFGQVACSAMAYLYVSSKISWLQAINHRALIYLGIVGNKAAGAGTQWLKRFQKQSADLDRKDT